MRGFRAWVAAAVSAALSAASSAVSAQVSPFEDVDWSSGEPAQVMVGGEWWEPVSIEGVGFAELYAFALREYGSEFRAQKRLDEDLLEVFERFGAPVPGERVRLILAPADGGSAVTLESIEMTRANRETLWAKRSGWGEGARPGDAAELAPGALLGSAAAVLARHHSYSAARDVDVSAELARARERLGEAPSGGAVVRELRRLLALSGDGHAGLTGRTAGRAERDNERMGALPLALAAMDLREGGRVVAIRSEGAGLLDEEHPYIGAIDGVSIERWLGVAAEVASGGSPQRRREGACEEMARPGWIRERLGLGPASSVLVTLESEEGGRKELKLGLTDQPARAFRRELGPARVIEGFAYLPIESMWDQERAAARFAQVRAELERACGAAGLVIDIRGNRGGSRDVLHLVASYVLAPDAEPVVYSAARVLMWPGREEAEVEEQLAGRYLFPRESDRWSAAERAAVERFLDGFTPEVDLPADRFGPLHVSVLSTGGEGGGRLAGTPIVVLMDERCISASDVFLAAMHELPGVTLVGRPSSGASGMSVRHEVGGSLTLWLSSMVSFMPDGRVFDWHGVEPDVPVTLTPEDFTLDGRDTALEAALAVLREEVARRRE